MIGEELVTESVLQETDSARVELCRDNNAQKVVRKIYRTSTTSNRIERAFLRESAEYNFHHLSLPRIIAEDEESLLMSFVDREHHTRDSILARTWRDTEYDSLLGAIEEFQSIQMPRSLFGMKQQMMGKCYPVIRAAMAFANSTRLSLIPYSSGFRIGSLAFEYTKRRRSLQRCLTHYDLTTLNCAFCPNGKVSILDFELSYYLGDPLFDLCYFVTIPVQPLAEWRFQRELLSRSYARSTASDFQEIVRFLLISCSLQRLLHFKNTPELSVHYHDNIKTLIHDRSFAAWWEKSFC